MPVSLSPENLRFFMGLAFFPVGWLAIVTGLIMLAAGPYRQEAKTLAAQSARLGAIKNVAEQKGLTENITQLTHSTTALIAAVNDLIRTSSGNAVVIIAVGAICEAAAYWLIGGG